MKPEPNTVRDRRTAMGLIALLCVAAICFISIVIVNGRAQGQQPGAAYSVCKSGCAYSSINAAIKNAPCGATILVSAGEVHYGGDENASGNNPVILRYKDCPAGTQITITTDQVARLPQDGTRITPNYADGQSRIAALIQNVGNGMVLTAEEGDQACPGAGPCPAHDYVLKGLEFCCSAGGFSDFIGIGSQGNGTADPKLNTIADLPSNITFDRVLIRQDPLANSRNCITPDGVNITLENSWLECGYDAGSSDSQAIRAFQVQGLTLYNNYISGTTETVTLRRRGLADYASFEGRPFHGYMDGDSQKCGDCLQ